LKEEYAIEINKFKILENLDNKGSIDSNINKKWKNIKTVIKQTKPQIIERVKAQKHLKINGTMRNANFQ